ncbi:carboxylating nicotinate-nucleotide diphosphorylase [Chloroflexota bacterium]
MTSEQLPEEEVNQIIRLALAEDTAHGDITSEALVPPNLKGKAAVLVKEKGILAGVEIARKVFHHVDASLEIATLIPDGNQINPGDIAAIVSGSIASILKAERTVLNFLQRLSGIASLTSQYVAAIRDSKARITDTRKTTPGIRALEKHAVRLGGGQNHRFHLGDGILIKDNHLTAIHTLRIKLADIVRKAKEKAPPGIKVEVEVTRIDEAEEALAAGADIIMLDNMSPAEMKEVVNMIAGKAEIEASGGINLNNVHQIAATGVDIISIGALTHSYQSLDISLELDPASLQLG